MKLWYGEAEVDAAIKKFNVEHHNNNAFDCLLENLSFTSDNLNLTKAHSNNKNQPQLISKAAVNISETSKKVTDHY